MYIGDGNNMANSLIVGGLKVGMEVSVACPEGYEPHPDVLAFAKSDPNFKFSLYRDPKQAAVGADVVFTDVWASMGQEEEKAIREKAFVGYQVNKELMALTNPGCMVQHCLPAHREKKSPPTCSRSMPRRSLTSGKPPPRPEGGHVPAHGRRRVKSPSQGSAGYGKAPYPAFFAPKPDFTRQFGECYNVGTDQMAGLQRPFVQKLLALVERRRFPWAG